MKIWMLCFRYINQNQLLCITKVTFTNRPQSIAAVTATIDFDIPVRRKKEIKTDKQSVKNGFLSKKTLIFSGK